MWHVTGASGALLVAVIVSGCVGSDAPEGGGARRVASGPASGLADGATSRRPGLLGRSRIETHGGLRVVHLVGTPEQRGRAHGELLGEEILRIARAELEGSFGKRPALLKIARAALPRLVRYPEPIQRELQSVFAVIAELPVSRRLDAFDRDFDIDDLLLLNALDIFGTFGCSGFTVWGDEVAGGGVLTGRNFDWPISGRHLVDNCMVLVQHPNDGPAFASVAWPGYVATVTGVNEHGIAVFLHVGSGQSTLAPRVGSQPTAVAARQILARSTAASAATVAAEELGRTSPPSSYITRVVLPQGDPPVAIFEVDHARIARRDVQGRCVVTNHFLTELGKGRGRDSQTRFRQIDECLAGLRGSGDQRVSPAEAWQALAKVQRSGKRFASLHSFVFRHSPWHFEVRLGEVMAGGTVKAAPSSSRRHLIPRAVLFP